MLLAGPAVRACGICGCFMGITPSDNQELGQRPQFRPAGACIAFPTPLNSDNGYAHNHKGDVTDSEAFRVIDHLTKLYLPTSILSG